MWHRIQFDQLKRRQFICLLGGAAAWPLASQAQQPTMPVIGFLSGRSAGEAGYSVAAFHRGLEQTGYIEGRNVAVDYRWGEGRYDRIPALADDLVKRQVAVIVAIGGSNAALAAKAATSIIPIVFITGDDPVSQGLVTSLNRPGGNATGINIFASEMEGKRIGLLRDLVPNNESIAVLLNPAYSAFNLQRDEVRTAANLVRQQILLLTASDDRELHASFTALVGARVGALLVVAEPFFNSRREQLVALAARHAIPTLYGVREYTVAGGLMSYGTSLVEAYRQVGIYTGRILQGDKPGELPVVQSVKFEFVVNLKTAKTLGLTFPPGMIALADEVIE